MERQSTADVPPASEHAPSPPRSPLSKLNLNDRGNRFREHVLNPQGSRERNELPSTARSPDIGRETNETPGNGTSHQTAVTPTSSNVRKQVRTERKSDKHEDKAIEDVDDPILSQFSSDPSSIESFEDSRGSSSDGDVVSKTSLGPPQVSGERKRRHGTSSKDDGSFLSSKRPRTDDNDGDTNTVQKSKEKKQTTLMSWFKKEDGKN